MLQVQVLCLEEKKETVPNDNQWHTLDFDLTNWGLWTDTINEFKFYNNFSSGSIVFDKIEFIPNNSMTHSITLSKEGQGLLNFGSGTALNGQKLSLIAVANEGWTFEGWEGDITSTDNPLEITVTSDLNIKAIFSNGQLSVGKNNFEKIVVFPNPSSDGVFQIKNQTPKSWQVYSITGKKIIEGKGNIIDISAKAKGIYILKINNFFVKLLY